MGPKSRAAGKGTARQTKGRAPKSSSGSHGGKMEKRLVGKGGGRYSNKTGY